MVVNLYPFQRLAAPARRRRDELVENIDIGGPAMLRAAAKNFRDVAVVCDPERYGFVLSELDDNGLTLSLPTRRELAAEAFAHTAGYDATIANWFTEAVDFPDRLFVEMLEAHRAAVRREPAPARRLLLGARRAPRTCCRWCTSTAAAASRSTTSPTSPPAATSRASSRCRRA